MVATAENPQGYPDLLYLSGPEVAENGHMKRDGVKNLLFSDGNGIKNFRGEVDFIICFIVDGIGPPNHSGVDHSPAQQNIGSGRPVRGILAIKSDLRQNVDAYRLGGLCGGLAHEVGHYWLAPGGAKIRTGQTAVDTPTSDEIAASLNRGDGVPPYPIMARQDRHWSVFLDSRHSVMDGINHRPAEPAFEAAYGYAYSEGEATTGVSFAFENMGTISPGARYSVLDLHVMGLTAAPSHGWSVSRGPGRFFAAPFTPTTLQPQDDTFYVMRPRWVLPHLPYHTGLYLELDNDDVWYHGFHWAPHIIRAITIDNQTQQSIDLVLGQLFNPRDRVAFRVVQRGPTVELQVRAWRGDLYPGLLGCLGAIAQRLGIKFVRDPAAWALPPLTCSHIMADMPDAIADASADVYVGWRTLATLNAQVTKMGVAARHMPGVGHSAFVRTSARLCLWQDGTVTDVPSETLTGVNTLDIDNPVGAHTRLPDGSFILPYRAVPGKVAKYFHDAETDNAPRLVINAPTEDFAFGGQITVEECLINNWAGGAGFNRTYVGSRQQFAPEDLDLSHEWSAEDLAFRQEEPLNGKYKTLFCLVSETPLVQSDLGPQLERLDLVRRAWEPCFLELTNHRREVDTTIN